jgi:ribonuclease R
VANNKDAVSHAVKSLAKKGFVLPHKDDYYQWNNENPSTLTTATNVKYVVGRVDMTRTGSAYIIADGMEEDIYVSERNIGTAMNRDTVKVEVPKRSGRGKIEGKVVEILTRSITHVIGTLHVYDKYAVVIPNLSGKFPDVYLKLDDISSCLEGDVVLAEITQWTSSQNKAIWGRVKSKLTKMDDHEVAMQSILIGAGFSLEFPENVIAESEAIKGEITPKDLSERRDFRDVLTFTIDPDTARDFDDAISYKLLENDHVEIGVHIADVTHFLTENSALDKEAYLRATSVYLVDRCVPMLPEKLSNDLCSLNPHEDKFTFSAVFIFNEKYKLISEWFGKTLIHSDRRFTYEEAQERLESGEGDLAKELRHVNDIALKLRKDKFKNGAINFESEEVKFVLDENNVPISLYVKERKDAHMLIEDFMLLANRSVAKYMAKKSKPEIPFVYRVHDMPDLSKLADFALFASEMGYKMKIDTPKHISLSLNGLATAIHSNEALKVLSPLAIRTMAKAEYSPKNIGHYGLAFEYYTHFTSPIRRYSDVLVHRILYKNLSIDEYRVDLDGLAQKCKHVSKQEVKASEAERESVKYKQVEYMQNHVGEEFTAQVSGMIDKGIFVSLPESGAEGFIPFFKLSEKYELATSRLSATARRTGDTIKMGDKIQVVLSEADLSNRQLTFEIV